MLKVGICGVTGFAGSMLLRLLSKHRYISITYLGSGSRKELSVNTYFNSNYDNIPSKFSNVDAKLINRSCDLVFLALPHTVSQLLVKDLTIPVIDLSADFRLSSKNRYEKWYKTIHCCPDKLNDRVYGMPEFFRNKIRNAKLIANPGCYATGAALSIYPFAKNKLCSWAIADSASGVTGAGKVLKSDLLFYRVDNNFKAYKVASHRHQPEIEEAIFESTKLKLPVTFVPHLLPIQRGILSTIYLDNLQNIGKDEAMSVIKKQYENEPFVKITDDTPQISDAAGTNYCYLYATVDDHNGKIIVISAIDNLLKGAAGQAVQNMNIAYGFSETEAIAGWLG